VGHTNFDEWDTARAVSQERETLSTEEAKVGSGNSEDRRFRPLLEYLLNEGRWEAKAARLQGVTRLSGSKESDRVWAIFDWDEAGWQSFTSDPDVPAIFQEAGFTQGPPKSAEFLRENYA
jgi:hypothetical protein